MGIIALVTIIGIFSIVITLSIIENKKNKQFNPESHLIRDSDKDLFTFKVIVVVLWIVLIIVGLYNGWWSYEDIQDAYYYR